MKLLLKIKNGTPPMRKAALRQITDKAREFGAGPLFNQILPLLMSPTLEDQVGDLLRIWLFFVFSSSCISAYWQLAPFLHGSAIGQPFELLG